MEMENNETPIKRSVLDFDDVVALVPKLKDKEKLVNRVFKFLKLTK